MEEYLEEDVSIILARREAIAEAILAKRDEAIRARAASGVERRWRDDEFMFDGLNQQNRPHDMIDYATGEATVRDFKQGTPRSRVSMNIVRGRCEVAEGRFSEVCIPTDKPWGLKPTPDATLVDLQEDKRPAVQNGEPIKKEDGTDATVGDIALDKQRIAREKMKKMETVMNDQLTESDFNAELRKAIMGAVRVGTGIIKGPNVIKSFNNKWVVGDSGVHELDQQEVFVPDAVCVDHWAVYPDGNCGDDVRKASFIWERDEVLPRDLVKLIGVPGYDEAAIRTVLEEEPKRAHARYDKTSEKYRTYDQVMQQGSAYERWEYYGEIDREDLECLGCDCEDVAEIAAKISACVVFVNDRPVKAELNLIDTGELPYNFFRWTQVSDSPWGIGVARQLFDVQRVITGAWRAMMDNAGDSSGANYIFGAGIQPVDGHWELTGKKAWRDTVSSGDVRGAFNQFQVENNQAELQNIIEMALQAADLETGIPTIFQGEVQKTPDTLGATNIMVDSSNIGIRQRVKLFVDDLLDPTLTRFYHWNMQFNKDEDIKGDYQVDAHGPGILLERDSQTQSLMQLFQLKNDPDINMITDWEKVGKQLLQNQRLDVLASEEEIKQRKDAAAKGGQPPPPQVQAAQIRSQTELQKAKLDAESSIKQEQLRGQRQQEDNQFKAADGEAERQTKLALEQMRKEMAMMDLAESSKLSLQQIKAQLATDSAKINAQKEIAAMSGKGQQIANPAFEPPGRARPGHAFEE